MRRSSEFLMCLVITASLGFGPAVSAQSTASQGAQSGAPGRMATNPLQIALTGCLKRSSTTGGYSISDQNGTIWELKSSSVNLAQHVNHSVTVTGKAVSAGEQPGPNNQQNGDTHSESKPQYILRVLTLQMLSPSCTR